MLSQDGKPGGFLLISAEPKELTVVHVVGSIDLASLQEVVNSTIHYDLKGARRAVRVQLVIQANGIIAPLP